MKNIVITLWMLRKGDNLARSVSYALCDHYNYQPSSNLYSICRLQVHILIVIHLSACSHFLLNSSLSCPYIVTYPHNIRVCMLTRTRGKVVLQYVQALDANAWQSWCSVNMSSLNF